MTWRALAACSELDDLEANRIFFGTHEIGPMPLASVRAAKQVCATCPVRTECLATALVMDEQFGIFGGLTTQERKRLVTDHGGQAGAIAAVAAGCSP